MRLRSTLLVGCFVVLSGAAMRADAGTELLTPALLHPLAAWGGSTGHNDGCLTPNLMTTLLDGDAATRWATPRYNASPTLSSPRPFVVRRVEVVISTGDNTRSYGTVEIMPVGSALFVSTGVVVPSNLPKGAVFTADIPAEHQVPVSAVRYSRGHFWMEMNELRFFGKPLGMRYENLSLTGTLQITPGTESPVGSLRNGVFETGVEGYYASKNGGGHRLVVNFGEQPKAVTHVAVAPNGYWKPSWRLMGSPTTPVNLAALSSYSGWAWDGGAYTAVNGSGAPGRTWVVVATAAQRGETLYAAGVEINNYWGCISEIAVLQIVPEPRATVILLR